LLILTVGNPGRNEVLVENAGGRVAGANGARDVSQFTLVCFHDGPRLRLDEVHVLAVSQRVLQDSHDNTFSRINTIQYNTILEMWANAQRDGRPAEYSFSRFCRAHYTP